jgi:ATP-dependent metalloprotease FtsH
VIKKTDIKFSDVIGQQKAKEDLKECIKYFKYREQYKKAGFKIPKGFLFTGPPGTGKTLLAKAFAGEADITFISTCGSRFEEIYVGVGSMRMRSLFEYARNNSPAIIFIDEIDALGRKRNNYTDAHASCSSTLNEFLTEMDGFTENDNIMVIGATNMSEVLDHALMRSGRFDEEIIFDPPNKEERKELFSLYLQNKRLHGSFDIDTKLGRLSLMSAGLTGADIANITNLATGTYLKRVNMDKITTSEDGVTMKDIEMNIDTVSIGMEKPERKMSDDEKITVAYHEAGHTLIAYMLKTTEIPIKVSIIPRGKSALGFTQQEPSDKKLYSKLEFISKMCVLIGGRIAEKLQFGTISTGAADDIEKLTKIAYSYVTIYGLDDEIGPINYYAQKSNQQCNLSDKTKQLVDDRVKIIIHRVTKFVDTALDNNKEALKKLATHLYKEEVIVKHELDDLLSEYNIKKCIDFF